MPDSREEPKKKRRKKKALKKPPEPSTAPEANKPKTFTAQEVLDGVVNPHQPEARVEAKARTPKANAEAKPGDLGTFNAADLARESAFRDSPADSLGDASLEVGESLDEMLERGRSPAARGLPEPEMRPPVFLSNFEGMKDIYFKVKGRASPRTQELLESADLEDLVDKCLLILEDEYFARKNEAQLAGPIFRRLKKEPGPLLFGLNDPRLAEPWRLFLDGWDIWVPDGADGEGVELFIEGESEDDDGDPIEILQALRFRGGELELEMKMGELEDTVTFDGEAFYRLKTKV